MKLAVLGDSHVAALRLGWDHVAADHPGVEPTFFAQRRDGLRDLTEQSGWLVPGTPELREAFRFTSGGLEAVDCAAYDAVLVHGLCAMPYFADPDSVYSIQVLDQALRDTRAGRLSQETLEKVHKAGAERIYVGHDPLPVENQISQSWPRAFYEEGLNLLNSRFYVLFRAQMIPQPQDTIGQGCFSLEHFTHGARRLAIGDALDHAEQIKGDRWRHMNAAFGALWWRNFLQITGAD